MALSETQIERYSRHLLLREVGGIGQQKLLSAKVLIVGAGGLGSPAALYLAAAGVGTIGLVDADVVDLTNLQRQILHYTQDVGKPKVHSAAETIAAMNPDVTVQTHHLYLRAEHAPGVIAGYDFVLDGTDNFATKFLVNDACHFAGKPYTHAGILRFDGQLMTVLPGETTCLRCIFDGPPPPDSVPTCAQAGVLGVLAGVIGALQAAEAIKFILGKGELITDGPLTYNALRSEFRRVRLRRNARCRLCGTAPSITELRDEAPPVCDLTEVQGCQV